MKLCKLLAIPALVLTLDSYTSYRLRGAYDEEARSYMERTRRDSFSRMSETMRNQISDIFPLDPEMPIKAWSVIPPGMIEEEMSKLYDRYSELINNRDAWKCMNIDAWSRVHAPARIAAFSEMVDFWVDYYGAGKKSGISKKEMSNTLNAIMIGESYFDHTATNRGDYGVSQISTATRATMKKWFKNGRKNGIDFNFGDRDYMNPYNSIRAGVWLFSEILENEAGGDLKLAIGAYNAGIRDAKKKTKRAMRYQKGIERIIDRYLTDTKPSNSPLNVALRIHKKRKSPD